MFNMGGGLWRWKNDFWGVQGGGVGGEFQTPESSSEKGKIQGKIQRNVQAYYGPAIRLGGWDTKD